MSNTALDDETATATVWGLVESTKLRALHAAMYGQGGPSSRIVTVEDLDKLTESEKKEFFERVGSYKFSADKSGTQTHQLVWIYNLQHFKVVAL